MNDLKTLNRRPSLFRLGGEAYEVHPLTLDEFGDLQAWVDSQFGDPVEVAFAAIDRGILDPDADGGRRAYTPAQQKYLLDRAMEYATRPKPKIGTPPADELLQSVEGIRELLFLSIRKGRPDFDRDAARVLFGRLTPGDLAKIQQATNVDMVTGDPKAPTTGGTTNPSLPPGPPTGGESTTS